MFELSANMYLHNGDSLLYYYGLNEMAFELAWQKKKYEAYCVLDMIRKNCNDAYVFAKTIETKAIACKMAEQYDSTLYYTSQSLALGFNSSTILLNKAQAFSLIGMKDSAVHYANILLSMHADMYDQCNALYILTQGDTTQNISEVRAYAADRADTQKLIERRRSRCAQAVQLLEQDLFRKPDLTWLYAIIATLVIIGASIGLYVRNKQKKNLLSAQKLNNLKHETSMMQEKHDEINAHYQTHYKQLEEDIIQKSTLLHNCQKLNEELSWTDYEQMCNIVDKHFNLLASKLQSKHSLKEKEVRLCVLTLIGMSRADIADTLPYAVNSVGKLKDETAKKLGTTGKNLHDFLLKMAVEG